MSRIRLLFIDHASIAGGSQLLLAEHIKALDPQQFEIHMACTADSPEMVRRFADAGAHVHLLDIPRLRGLRPGALLRFADSVRRLRRLVKEERIQLAISGTTRASYMLTAATFPGVTPTMWWVLDFVYPPRLFRLLRNVPKRIIYVSRAIRDHYGGADDPRSLVWYAASDIHVRLHQVTPESVAQEREKYGFRPSDVVVGSMGRLVAEKGPEDLIRAVASLAEDFPQLRCLIVGTGKDQPNDVEAELHRLVRELGLESRIRFAGFQPNEPLYYSMLDLFVLATRDREPYATSVVKAMMAGKPVIGTRAGGTPEIIEDGVTGLLYPPANVESLSAAIRRLVSEPDLRRRLASSAHEQVMQNNRGDQLAREAEAIYRELAGP